MRKRRPGCRYTLSFWGVGFGHIQYSNLPRGGAYAAEAHFETQGMVSFFWNAKVWAELNLGTVTAALDSLKIDGEAPAL